MTGNAYDCRVLLDSASQSNFLTKEFCDRLQLPTQKLNCSVGGLSASINLTEVAHADIQSKHSGFKYKLQFLIINQIINRLPFTEVEVNRLQIPANIKLADEKFHVPARVDAILGAATFWSLLYVSDK